MMHFLRQLLLVLPVRAWISNNSFWIFVGDSTARFQYLTLAYYLRTGNWSAPSGGGGNLTDAAAAAAIPATTLHRYNAELPHHPPSAGCNTSSGRSHLVSKWQASLSAERRSVSLKAISSRARERVVFILLTRIHPNRRISSIRHTCSRTLATATEAILPGPKLISRTRSDSSTTRQGISP